VPNSLFKSRWNISVNPSNLIDPSNLIIQIRDNVISIAGPIRDVTD
jgi:hypothetical protein